ncbi:MAG: SUMF1/EgtB/PvdO family nonheme iron enzyme, partial [Candidatus Muirbacterium halophilum]|nr:SUMF1/EgtB/PvdO family nonheme iron enzyme [Candidatus Muirbacterium halophilum]
DKKNINPWEKDDNGYSELIIDVESPIDDEDKKHETNNNSDNKDNIWDEFDLVENDDGEVENNTEEIEETKDIEDKTPKKSNNPWHAENYEKEELVLDIDDEIEEDDDDSEVENDTEEIEETKDIEDKTPKKSNNPWHAENYEKEELDLDIDIDNEIEDEDDDDDEDTEDDSDDSDDNDLEEDDHSADNDEVKYISDIENIDDYHEILGKNDDDMDFDELQDDILKSFSKVDFNKVVFDDHNHDDDHDYNDNDHDYIDENCDAIDKNNDFSDTTEQIDSNKKSFNLKLNKKIYLFLIAFSILVILLTIILSLFKNNDEKVEVVSDINKQISRIGERDKVLDVEIKVDSKESMVKQIPVKENLLKEIIPKQSSTEQSSTEQKLSDKKVFKISNFLYTIDSQPQGAKVIIDKKKIALTPYNGESESEEISVTLEHKYFESKSFIIDVSKNNYNKLVLDKRKTGILKIKTYPPALIRINDDKWEESPFEKTLPYDNYRVEIKKDGFSKIVDNIEFVEENKVIEYNPDILPPLGKIEVVINDVFSRGGEFSWNDIENTEKYIVFIDNAEYAEVSETKIRISDLSPDTDYNISIIAQNKGGRSKNTVKKRFRTFRKPGDIKNIEIFPGISLEMVFIPPGVFKMGGSDGNFLQTNEIPAHEVKISRGFYISKYEITQKQFEKVTGYNPSKFKDPNLPAESVKWNEAIEFCNALSWSKNLKERYVLNQNNIDIDYNANGFRLPTEAEWEYCYRAGTQTRFYWGDKEHSDYYQGFTETNGKPVKPGQKKPNDWGLYDMAGNVWEWCEDYYSGSFYKESPEIDPVFNKMRSYKVIRGGSCNDDTDFMRGSSRGMYGLYVEAHTQGFRVILPE